MLTACIDRVLIRVLSVCVIDLVDRYVDRGVNREC